MDMQVNLLGDVNIKLHLIGQRDICICTCVMKMGLYGPKVVLSFPI